MSAPQHSQHSRFHERALAAGYSHNQLPVVPHDATTSLVSPGKTPGIRSKKGTWSGFLDWATEQETTPEKARLYDQWDAGLGFRGGVRGLTGIDIDVTDPILMGRLKASFYALLPLDQWENFPERGVDHPDHVKTLLMCCAVDDTGTPVALPSTYDVHFQLPDAQPGDKPNGVQLIASGRYFNAYGTHPDRKVPYIWNTDVLALGLANVPKVPATIILEFMAGVPAIVMAHGAMPVSGTPRSAIRGPRSGPMPNAFVIAILKMVPNHPLLFPGYERWQSFGQNLKAAAINPDDPELMEAWVEWTHSWPGFPDPGQPELTPGYQEPIAKWESFDPDYAHAGSFRNLVSTLLAHPKPGDADFDIREKWASDFDAFNLATPIEPGIRPAASTFSLQSPEPASVSLPDDLADLFEQLRLARPTPAVYAVPPSRTGESFDPNSLGNLEVINPHVMGYYTRGRTTMLLAVPGAGKSSLMASTAAALLFERPDIVDEPDAGFPGSAVLVSNEDDKAIIAGKLRALMDYHHLQPASALHEVLLFNGIKLLTRDSSGVFHLACVSFLKELIELRKRRDIALIVFDTLISLTRGVEENSNEQMQVVLEFFTRLAAAAHAAVVIIHHVSKSGLSKDGEIGIYGGRGASSMAADMRSTIQVLKPSPADRDEYKWSDTAAKAWVKVLPLKGSYDDPSTWVPKWFHFRSVLRPALDIRNPALPSLRAFGVLVPETPVKPSPQAAFGSLAQQARQAWGILDAALNQGQVWNLKTRSKSKAVAKVLLGRDFEATKELLDILIGWGVMVIPNQETQEIIKVVGVMLPETEPESDRNLDRNLEE